LLHRNSFAWVGFGKQYHVGAESFVFFEDDGGVLSLLSRQLLSEIALFAPN
jgi:hypothetical protein